MGPQRNEEGRVNHEDLLTTEEVYTELQLLDPNDACALCHHHDAARDSALQLLFYIFVSKNRVHRGVAA